MPTTKVSPQDRLFKSQALRQQMDLNIDLSSFSKSLDEIMQLSPPMKLTPSDKTELEHLSASIKGATADNHTRARVIELLGKGLA